MLNVIALTVLISTQDSTYAPTSQYKLQNIKGWNIYIDTRIQKTKPILYKKAINTLNLHLDRVLKVVPKSKIPQLQTTPIWMDYTSPANAAACYHPSKKWLQENNHNPQKAKAVEISHADKFVDWTPMQPYMILHELAHAYHDQVLSFDHKPTIDSYNLAVKSKKYDVVKHIQGKTQRHYGLTNHKEWFAEMTETYLGKNDMAPFNRAELKASDPAAYNYIASIWKD